jgi:hypothetical protein
LEGGRSGVSDRELPVYLAKFMTLVKKNCGHNTHLGIVNLFANIIPILLASRGILILVYWRMGGGSRESVTVLWGSLDGHGVLGWCGWRGCVRDRPTLLGRLSWRESMSRRCGGVEEKREEDGHVRNNGDSEPYAIIHSHRLHLQRHGASECIDPLLWAQRER